VSPAVTARSIPFAIARVRVLSPTADRLMDRMVDLLAAPVSAQAQAQAQSASMATKKQPVPKQFLSTLPITAYEARPDVEAGDTGGAHAAAAPAPVL
jgi:hypothetical protein